MTEGLKVHHRWMKEAVKVAESALLVKETPVACIFVYQGKIIGQAFNQTNISLNGTKHAEFEAFEQIRSKYPETFADVLKETDLYVTVEPCIMCASLLRQLQIRRVFFGCANERFGGNGSIFKVNKDYPASCDNCDKCERTYEAIPGILAREAIMLLRRFYLLENEKSPTLKDKKHRKLEENDFPALKYSDYMSKKLFVEYYGPDLEFVYDNSLMVDFDSEGTPIIDHTKRQKI